MRKKIMSVLETVLLIALIPLVGAQLYGYVKGPDTPGPQVGEVLDLPIDGDTTVVVFTTTCSWCAKSWPRWKQMDNITLVSLSPVKETEAYLEARGVMLPVTYARINTPVPLELDVDTNLRIVEKRLGYQGEPQ